MQELNEDDVLQKPATWLLSVSYIPGRLDCWRYEFCDVVTYSRSLESCVYEMLEHMSILSEVYDGREDGKRRRELKIVNFGNTPG